MPLQNHVHISTTLGGSPEFAPDIKWVITDRLDTTAVSVSLRESLNGKRKNHVLANQSGPVQHNDFRYTIKVKEQDGDTLEERIAMLKALEAKTVYLCDSFHANDGTSHVSTTRQMFVVKVGDFPPVGPGLQYFNVDIELRQISPA